MDLLTKHRNIFTTRMSIEERTKGIVNGVIAIAVCYPSLSSLIPAELLQEPCLTKIMLDEQPTLEDYRDLRNAAEMHVWMQFVREECECTI